MTRDKLVHQFVYWFRLNPFTCYTDWENWYALDTSEMKHLWLQQASPEWFPNALDIAINPPDLSPWQFDSSSPSWNADDEFLIEMEHLLGEWYYYDPDIWIQEMTPLLNNQVDVSGNKRYPDSRRLALYIYGWGINYQELADDLLNQLVNWIEPLTKNWRELHEDETNIVVDRSCAFDYWRPNSQARQLLLKLQPLVDEHQREWIENTVK